MSSGHTSNVFHLAGRDCIGRKSKQHSAMAKMLQTHFLPSVKQSVNPGTAVHLKKFLINALDFLCNGLQESTFPVATTTSMATDNNNGK